MIEFVKIIRRNRKRFYICSVANVFFLLAFLNF